MTRPAQWFAALQLVAAIGAAVPLLWHADQLGTAIMVAWAGVIVLGLWLGGAVMQSRITVRTGVLITAAVIGLVLAAAASAVTRDQARQPKSHIDARVSPRR